MASTTRDNVVPLYFNSADRINISDSTSDYTIRLRKTLGNISSISITDVGIPATYTNVSNSSNALYLSFFDGSKLSPFNVSVPPMNYTSLTLATALTTAINIDPVSLAYGLNWHVEVVGAAVGVADKFSISITWTPGGAVPSWGIDVIYTPMVDVLGIGNGGTTTLSTRVSYTDILIVSIGRVAALYNNIKLNVTSSALSEDINTSYISSLGKSFTVGSTNNTLVLSTQQTLTNYIDRIPYTTGGLGVIKEGCSVAISALGDIIVAGGSNDAGGRGASFVYQQLSQDGPHLQRVGKLVGNNPLSTFPSEGSVVSLSGDGKTLVAAAPNDSIYDSDAGIVTNGACWVYTRSGVVWVKEAKLVVPAPSDVWRSTGSGGGRACSLSDDGNIMVTIATRATVSGVYFYHRTGSTWGTPFFIHNTDFNGSTLVSAAVSSDGTTVVVSNQTTTTVYVANGDPNQPWILQQQLGVGGPASISDNGNTILAVDKESTEAHSGWIYTRAAGVYTLAFSLDMESGKVSGSVSGDGISVAVGIPTPLAGSVVIFRLTTGGWVTDATVTASEEGGDGGGAGVSVALSRDGSALAFGGNLHNAGLGGTWLWKRAPVSGIWSEKYGNNSEARQVLKGNDSVSTIGAGQSIALSKDASLLVVGTPYNNKGDGNTRQNTGGVALYTRAPPGAWVQQEGLLLPYSGGQDAFTGWAVSISNNGMYIAVGAPGYRYTVESYGMGAIDIYKKSDASWDFYRQHPGFQFGGESQTVSFGKSVTIDDNGTVAVGDPGYDGDVGAVIIINIVGFGATFQRLVAPWSMSAGQYGASVAFSGDGNTLAIGIPFWERDEDDPPSGNVAVWVLDVATGLWSQQTALVDNGFLQGPSRGNGTSVALSYDGNTLVSGAPNCEGAPYRFNAGAVNIYRRDTSLSWERTQCISSGDNFTPFGLSVAITDDAKIVAQGGGGGIVTADNFVDRGGVTIYKYNDSTMSWLPYGPKGRGVSAIEHSVQGTSVAICYIPGTTDFIVEFGGVTNTWGNVWTYISNGYAPLDYTAIVPNGSYTVFALVTLLESILVFPTLSFTATFDNIGGTVTLTVVGNVGVAATFTVATSSTFTNIFLLPLAALPQATSITSLPLDFTINNNVIKSLNSHLVDGAPFIFDTSVSTIYRKYRAGYTLSIDNVIDVQLRDERDRIVNLNGANWIMTVNATIHT